MQVRTHQNYNFETEEVLFGLSIKLDIGHRYCKYPAEHQGYKTITDATEAKKKVMEQIRNGAHLEYGASGSKGVNKPEYVRIAE